MAKIPPTDQSRYPDLMFSYAYPSDSCGQVRSQHSHSLPVICVRGMFLGQNNAETHLKKTIDT